MVILKAQPQHLPPPPSVLITDIHLRLTTAVSSREEVLAEGSHERRVVVLVGVFGAKALYDRDILGRTEPVIM